MKTLKLINLILSVQIILVHPLIVSFIISRANETQEEAKKRKIKDATAHRLARSKESDEKRQKRKELNAENMRKSRQNETDEQWNDRLEIDQNRHRKIQTLV